MNTNLSVQDLLKLASGMQNNRLLRLSFPQGDAPYDILLVNRLEGEEYLSRDFRFIVEILSDNAKLDPKDFVDKQISVELLRNDGSFRYFNGYIFAFRLVKTDGGIAFYEAEMGPWVRYLTLRKNNRLFLDQPIHGQTADIFSDYGALAVWDWSVREKDPVIPMACQFDEHDHNYVHRRWEHRGLCYWYEHTAKEHKLIVSDPKRSEPAIDGPSPEIPYQDKAGSQEADGIKSWSVIHQSTSTHVAESRTDFKHFTLNARSGGFVDSRTDAWKDSGKQKLESYRYAGSFGHQNTEDGQKLTDVQVEAIEAIARQWEATGNNRFVMPGRWFQLTDHFGYSISNDKYDDEYLITFAHHVATNNYLQGVGAPATYSNRFRCVHLRTPWRPARGYNSVDTRILAPQTAMVVGPEGESLYTDAYGRVLVQFHWDREGKYTTWVRVSTGWAGGNQGMTALPRIGSEVIVMWLDGNPDHPIITGRLHGRDNMSAWQLPHQRALTGIRSRELVGDQGNQDGGRSNHLVFDDTANAIQTQLRSDHAASQLSLGSITRVEDWQGRQDARGEGFELRTDAVGAIRSGKGMLVSTEARPKGNSHISDVSEPVSRLAQAQTLHNELGNLAQQHRAQDSGGDQVSVADVLQAQVDGIKGGLSRGGDSSFPELNQPHLLLAGAGGLQATTPATVHVNGGDHVAVTAGRNVSVTARKSLLVSVLSKISLFAQNLGIKLFAAKGPVEIQAQSDKMALAALKDLSISSTDGKIVITAAKEVWIGAGGSYIQINGNGIVNGSPGPIVEKTPKWSKSAADTLRQPLPTMPQGDPTDISMLSH
ncbi:type VI secretion system tip protein VgrG [Trinickia dabaoshanensis]|uniref:Type VI secretion system tip protein VgrG n=1 Tax=Trinickia dabaoshanensis TaxID=564714 RepID=A0A2N7VB11_9BURK|nr:type VI secretion system Vgr family protein [Trinickia dabaoshanensis]PMS14351.1 type VI secretion system tip protein VgrG [Trinickia dabaoshanensis]